MAFNCEGSLTIPLEDFWEWASKYNPTKGSEIRFGVPRVTKFDLVIDFAASDDVSPDNWDTPPKCLEQWKLLG